MGNMEKDLAQLLRGLSPGLSQYLLCVWGKVVSSGHTIDLCNIGLIVASGASVSALSKPERGVSLPGTQGYRCGCSWWCLGRSHMAQVVWPGGAQGGPVIVRRRGCSFLKGK